MMQSSKKRRIAAVSSLAVAALALTSCALGSDLEEASNGGDDSEVKRLVLAQSSDFKSLDPQNLVETPAERIMRNVYSRLFTIDDDMQPQPDLVTEYEQPDDLTWIFHLREDVTFQNGDALTADDVAFSLNRPSDDDGLLEYLYWNGIDDVTAVDEHTVQIKTKEPMPTLIRLLAKSGGDIMPSKLIDEIGLEEFFKAPIGSGPYQIRKWTPDDRIVLDAYDDYFGGEPTWDEVEFRVIPEASTRIGELLTGGVDIITDIPPVDWDRLESEESADVVFGDTTRTMLMLLRNKEGWITADKRVREAIDLAIDNEEITEGLYKGAAKPIRSRVPVGIFGANPDLQDTFVYDLDRAKELVSEVEAETGEPIVLNITAPNNRYPLDADATQMIAQMLEEAGFTVKLEVLEGAAMSDAFGNNTFGEGMIIGLADALLDAKYSVGHYLAGDPANVGRADYDNPKVNELLREANTSLDQDQREKNYQEALQIIADDRAHVFLYQLPAAYGVSKRVTFEPRLDDRTYFDDITLN